MWDEQERFAKAFSKIFTWLLAVFGVVLAATSLATGIPDFFFVFILLLAALAALVLIYGLVAASFGGVLLGITSGVTCCFHWLRNHRFNHPAGR
jgi:hypothetical protein